MKKKIPSTIVVKTLLCDTGVMGTLTEMESLKREFLEHIEIERGRSVKTVRNYDHYLSRFFTHTGIKTPHQLTEQVVREFRLWLNRQEARPGMRGSAGATVKKRTQNYYLIALRAFLKYLRKRGVTSLEPERIELAKVGDRSLDLITNAELERLLAAPSGSDLKSVRDRALLHLLFSTGLRVAELCSLNIDLDLTKDEFSVRGKGDKVRVVFLSNEAKEAVRAWLKARKDMGEALFVSISAHTRGEDHRLVSRTVQRIVKHYATKAGITRKVTPHVIRHAFATDLLGNGADIRSVQALLGHANIVTTQIYTHVTDAHLREVHQRFHGKKRG